MAQRLLQQAAQFLSIATLSDSQWCATRPLAEPQQQAIQRSIGCGCIEPEFGKRGGARLAMELWLGERTVQRARFGAADRQPGTSCH